METKRLHQFKIIVDAGGLVKASELLGISGGGLSKSVQALEDELGFDLFIQRGRGLELTPAGKRLYDRVPEVLRNVEDLLRFEKSLATESVLRIASFEVFTTYFLGAAISRFFKNRSVDVREAIPGEMESLIVEEHSDLGVTYLPIPHAEVEFQKVGRIRMGIFGLKERWKGIPLEEIPFVVPITPLQGTPSGVQGLDGWPDHLFSRKILFRVGMMETAMQLCRRGNAVAFLPEFVVKIANQQSSEDLKLGELALPQDVRPVYRDIHLIFRKGFKETKEVRDLAKALRALE